MTIERSRRLGALEARRAPVRGGVVHQQPGESVEAACDRAIAGGKVGPFIVVPAPLSEAEWSARAAATQRDLAERAARIIAGGPI